MRPHASMRSETAKFHASTPLGARRFFRSSRKDKKGPSVSPGPLMIVYIADCLSSRRNSLIASSSHWRFSIAVCIDGERHRSWTRRSEVSLCHYELEEGTMSDALILENMLLQILKVAVLPWDVLAEEPDGGNLHVRIWWGPRLGNWPRLLHIYSIRQI